MKDVLFQYASRLLYRSKVYYNFGRLKVNSSHKDKIIDDFHILFYDSHILGKTWNNSTFLGTTIQKCPMDLFVYQEILYEVKPDIIIEAGTAYGGGALFLASICDLIKKGRVVTIDNLKIPNRPNHKRIKYILGSSVDDLIINQVKKEIKKGDKVMVILDSNHTKNHVLKELNIYSKFVSKGSYLIVEDSNVNKHPVYSNHGPGPMEALMEFLKKNDKFEIDRTREKFYLTFNPSGYLKRVK